MKYFLINRIFFVLFCCFLFAGCNNYTKTDTDTGGCRVISLAPSVTDIIYAIDGENNLVGVTRFCKNPDNIQTVGGYMDFNKETFVSLRPSLVYLASYHTDAIEICRKNNIKFRELDLDSMDAIPENIRIISEDLNRAEEGQKLICEFNKHTDAVKPLNKEIKVLIALDRDYGTGDVGKVYAVGSGGIFAGVIKKLGCRNAYEGSLKTPILTAEGITELNPDVIVDVVPEEIKCGNAEKDWDKLNINAVRNKKIFVLCGKEYSVPNEKFYQTAEKIREFLISE